MKAPAATITENARHTPKVLAVWNLFFFFKYGYRFITQNLFSAFRYKKLGRWYVCMLYPVFKDGLKEKNGYKDRWSIRVKTHSSQIIYWGAILDRLATAVEGKNVKASYLPQGLERLIARVKFVFRFSFLVSYKIANKQKIHLNGLCISGFARDCYRGLFNKQISILQMTSPWVSSIYNCLA